ncbi:MAG: DUF72 domain-containing protein [Oceanospirillaceae bacterium]|nr:DUF72 domain-containing protein [Oceanospirillaceae bacterium]
MFKNYHTGLAQWHHRQWYQSLSSSKRSLSQYSSCFSTVEGNSSFYALPSIADLRNWAETTPDDFKFCFKFPREISHKQSLIHCSRQVSDFLNRISLLNGKLGVIWLQLGHKFSADALQHLEKFLAQLPNDFDYAVEVRHLDFYRKDEVERQFNQLLIKHNVNRVVFDTRSLFGDDTLVDEATLEAKRAKPKVPTHVIRTGHHPFIRVIVPMDRALGAWVLEQWVNKVLQWIEQGVVPYMFFHTPDNATAPQLAVKFNRMLHQQNPEVALLCDWAEDDRQTALF